MFQFPRFPPLHSQSVTCLQVGLPHSDSLGSLVASTSPRHFAAWPRPSSAESAKASTMCSSLTMSGLVFSSVSLCYGARGDTSYRHARRPGRPTSVLKVQTHTHHGWSRGDSNPGPPPCKGGALPAKLRPLLTHPCHPLNEGGRAWTRTRDLGLIRAAL